MITAFNGVDFESPASPSARIDGCRESDHTKLESLQYPVTKCCKALPAIWRSLAALITAVQMTMLDWKVRDATTPFPPALNNGMSPSRPARTDLGLQDLAGLTLFLAGRETCLTGRET